MMCPNCEKTAEQLEAEGKLRYVQGYAQCGHCYADLDYDSVVKRTKNEELRRYHCSNCGCEFAWHLVFVSQGAEKCPRCQSKDIKEVAATKDEDILVACLKCDNQRAVRATLWKGSLWLVSGRCDLCQGEMHPMEVMEGELAVFDEAVCGKESSPESGGNIKEA